MKNFIITIGVLIFLMEFFAFQIKLHVLMLS